jgi:hypothetical protein
MLYHMWLMCSMPSISTTKRVIAQPHSPTITATNAETYNRRAESCPPRCTGHHPQTDWSHCYTEKSPPTPE